MLAGNDWPSLRQISAKWPGSIPPANFGPVPDHSTATSRRLSHGEIDAVEIMMESLFDFLRLSETRPCFFNAGICPRIVAVKQESLHPPLFTAFRRQSRKKPETCPSWKGAVASPSQYLSFPVLQPATAFEVSRFCFRVCLFDESGC
jgi:hypothetical protein